MITIKLPYPSSALMPNRKNGRHWGETASIKSQAIHDAYYLTKESFKNSILIADKVSITLTFVRKDKISADLDNCLAASKAALDGVAKALGIDDKRFEPITLKRGVASQSYLLIEIGE